MLKNINKNVKNFTNKKKAIGRKRLLVEMISNYHVDEKARTFSRIKGFLYEQHRLTQQQINSFKGVYKRVELFNNREEEVESKLKYIMYKGILSIMQVIYLKK
ncbi:hypothetical protein KHA80_20090 [Anaerobacillus sp. HL2]|nr:hypothetical protein KHA80_20090 [Anaerobacillus sp. HL2]